VAEASLNDDLVQKAVNTVRMLSLDGVEAAGCGHPGLPMGAADYACVLWTKFLRYNPDDPAWLNRDRFILSAGHGCMLVYSLLYLTGFDVSLEDLKSFRQLGSKTPGHPEQHQTPGIEATTGPLGQGFANGIGMAVAARRLAAKFNAPGRRLIDHTIYAICSDGDMMEGISHEAASIAGHLGLDNVIYYYDDNHISIEGSTDLTFSEDVAARFEGYGWHVQKIDGHDREACEQAIINAQAESERPSLIVARTHIGYGSPNLQDTAKIHGAAIGPEETRLTKENLGWPLEPEFYIPDDVRDLFLERASAVKPEYDEWQDLLEKACDNDPEFAAAWTATVERSLPDDLEEQLLAAVPDAADATRNHGGKIINAAAAIVPALMGGSADLSPSTKTDLKEEDDFARDNYAGRNLHFGVREHAMGAMMNGMACYGGFIPYGSTFLVFSDYMRTPVRLAAISGLQSIFIFTHDSIFVGEDGPTHQGIEQVASMRAMPGLVVIRPGDGPETAIAWAVALRRKEGPTALILSRQKVPVIDRSDGAPATEAAKGGYILREAKDGRPDVILIATGSELALALDVQQVLESKGTAARVVSMPSTELFDTQDEDYRREVLPSDCPRRVVIEAGVSYGWHKYGGPDALCICIDRFGESGPCDELAEKFGFTCDKVVEKIAAWL